MINRRTAARLGAATGAGLLIAGLAAAPASAHVTISPTDTAAGAYVVLTVSIPHGCDGSATTGIDIQIPEQIVSVTPTILAGWQAEKTMVELPEPIEDAHGNSITERVGEVSYTTDQPLADDYRAAMELSLQLPETPGETLVFPVVQTCEQGQTAWTEVAAEGQDADELEHPAPTVTVTEATGDHSHGDEAAEEASDESGEAPATTTRTVEVESDSNVALGLAGLGAGLVGIVIALMALLRSRRDA